MYKKEQKAEGRENVRRKRNEGFALSACMLVFLELGLIRQRLVKMGWHTKIGQINKVICEWGLYRSNFFCMYKQIAVVDNTKKNQRKKQSPVK